MGGAVTIPASSNGVIRDSVAWQRLREQTSASRCGINWSARRPRGPAGRPVRPTEVSDEGWELRRSSSAKCASTGVESSSCSASPAILHATALNSSSSCGVSAMSPINSLNTRRTWPHMIVSLPTSCGQFCASSPGATAAPDSDRCGRQRLRLFVIDALQQILQTT